MTTSISSTKTLSLIIIVMGLVMVGASCTKERAITTETNSTTVLPDRVTNEEAVSDRSLPSGFVSVYLRSTPVNLHDPRFVTRRTTGGLILQQAWYDATKSYLVVGTAKSYWQYCSVSPESWELFTPTASFDTIVTSEFKRRHLCVRDTIPLYADDAVAAGFAAPTDGGQVIRLRQVIGDETCQLNEYCDTETENGDEEEVFIYEREGDYLLGIGEDDVAVEVVIP